MDKNIQVYILRVFITPDNKFGNQLGVIKDNRQEIDSSNRQKIASILGFSELVYINDLEKSNISLFNPISEVNFAGHALLGTSYLINHMSNKNINYLNCNSEHIKTWQEGDFTWIESSLDIIPPWNHKQLNDPHSVEKLSNLEISKFKHTMVWAWIDKEKGIIRARTFAPDWGIPEDQGNGSGSMQLSVIVNQKIEIVHGEGSVIYAHPLGKNIASLGGRVKIDKSQIIKI